jgi:LAO/AO transport system kinase
VSDAGTVADLLERARAGEARATGRLLTLVERGGAPADAVAEATHAAAEGAAVVGITGAPGVGKSTLLGGLLATLERRGRRPAVLAVDPSSPLTGGAILGDRLRMVAAGSGAFVRSLATRGQQGGLALAVPGSIRVLDAAGFDPVLIETTGVGQVEVDVASATDTTVLVVAPGWGDAVQANKAGLLELADVLVVNKADRPGADDAVRDLELMLDLGHVSGLEERRGRRAPVVRAVASREEGLDDVADAIEAHRAHLLQTGELAARRAARDRGEVRARVEALLAARTDVALASPLGASALGAVREREISTVHAARRIADRVAPPA